MPQVNPDILRWARETAGFSREQAARKISLKEARGVPGDARLAELEAGRTAPSRTLLERMAQQYRRSLLTFYLPERPRTGDRGEDYRTIPDAKKGTSAPLLDALLRDIKARQDMLRTVLVEEEEAQPLQFINSMRVGDGAEAVIASIRRTIKIASPELRTQSSPTEVFAVLRNHAESAGIFVLLAGNLGSYHTALDVEVFRGFALADKIAPFVVINDLDARSAWSFTLLHELAHLWIGATGVSGFFSQSRTEQFCSDVASKYLLPDQDLELLSISSSNIATAAEAITTFARDRHLSRSMVAYRLLRRGAITQPVWSRLSAKFREEWNQSREAQRARARETDGGPNYYVVRRHRLGSAILRVVGRNLSEGNLTPTKAARILGVKARSVEPLLRGASITVAGTG